jgi:hypothetical protein
VLVITQPVLDLLRVEKTEESVDAAKVYPQFRGGFYCFEEDAEDAHHV